MNDTESLYAKIGGKAALMVVVDEFYRRVLADPRLAPLFAATDMQQQRGHQVAFLAAALGGPMHYTGRDMATAHRGLGITVEQFAAVATHLGGALAWAHVPPEDRDRILATAASLAPQIVTA